MPGTFANCFPARFSEPQQKGGNKAIGEHFLKNGNRFIEDSLILAKKEVGCAYTHKPKVKNWKNAGWLAEELMYRRNSI